MGVGSEVTAGRRLDAVRLAAIEDRVQVQLEDLALGVVPIHDQGQDGLLGFALNGVVGIRPDEQLLDELLADGATTLLDAMVGVVGQGGAEDRGRIDPAVRVEGVVLDGDRRVDDVRRDVADRHDDPVIALVADIGEQVAVAIEDQHVLRQDGGGQPGNRRNVADRLRRHGRHGQQGERKQHDEGDDQISLQAEPAPALPLTQVVVRMPVWVAAPIAAPHPVASSP